MAKDLFNRYFLLVDTIYRANGITFEEINEKWTRSSMSDGADLPLKTFHNHRKAIEEMFDIDIACDKRGGYIYCRASAIANKFALLSASAYICENYITTG